MDEQQKTTLLEYMLSVSQQMVALRALTPLLSYAIDEVLTLVGAEQGYIVLLNEDGSLDFQVKRNAHGQDITSDADPISHSILDEAIQYKRSVLVRNALFDPRFATAHSVIAKRKRSIMCVPLINKEKVLGAIYVENRSKSDQFRRDDLMPLEFFSNQAAVAIENASLNDNLEYLVVKRTQELEETNKEMVVVNRALTEANVELQTSNDELDAFAHTVAHDLKTPLSLVIGYGQILVDDFESMSLPEIREYLQYMLNGSTTMDSIISELLLLASVRQMDEIPLDILMMEGVMEEVNGRLQSMLNEYQTTITMPPKWHKALGYGPWIEEIWVNYISNALKYGGTPPTVEVGSSLQADGYVCFWVKDNGPGLTPEQQGQLFAQFTRLHKTRAQGHGLGLSIVQRIAQKLGGTVGVRSTIGEGSIFYFTMPVPSDSR